MSVIKSFINFIIKGINILIGGINKISFDVPYWVPGIGGKTLGFDIPKIPLLAKGAVVSQPTPAVIGDAGAEMVLPLERHTEALDYLADRLASKIDNSGSSATYIIKLDSRVLQRGVAKQSKSLAFETNGGVS